MQVSVSFLSSKYDTPTTIKLIEQTDADYIHLDMMDGKFVPNKNYDILEITNFFQNTTKPLEAHLMYENPYPLIDHLAKLNVKRIYIHLEIENPEYILKKIKNLKIETGLAINPDTPLEVIKPYLPYLDSVLIMSVNPGFGGQAFLPSILPKLKELREIQKDYKFKIAIDGGINDSSFKLVKNYIDLAISGSYICKTDDYQRQINTLRS